MTMINQIAAGLDDGVKPSPDGCEVTLGGGTRRQKVRVDVRGENCRFTSVVLPAGEVTRTDERWRQLARIAWQRNVETDVVTFTFDRRHRLIGRIQHPAATLDAPELEFYLRTIARECDRFKYLLSGLDCD